MGNNYLVHHGILKQQWGVRHGPPYPLKGGDYSKSEREAIIQARRNENSIYSKKHFDKVVKKGESIQTLSRNADRTKDSGMFFAAYTKSDKRQYLGMFNTPILDDSGNKVYKYKIKNTLQKDLHVASEDSAADVFTNLYSTDRDFYNFVTDESRMLSYFGEAKLVFSGYRESRDTLNKIQSGETPSSADLQVVYRMFNYILPSDGGDPNSAIAKDILKQRTKFFEALKEEGYGAVLDVNDAIYASYHAEAPILVFDAESFVPESVMQSSMMEQKVSKFITTAKRSLTGVI